MPDKFFETIKDRFEHHAGPIRENLRYLDYLSADYFGHLDSSFIDALEETKKQLKRMEEIIDQVQVR